MNRMSRRHQAGSRKNKQRKAKGTREQYMQRESDYNQQHMRRESDYNQSLVNYWYTRQGFGDFVAGALRAWGVTPNSTYRSKPNHAARAVDINTVLVKPAV